MYSLWCFLLLSVAIVEGRGILYKVPQEFVGDLLRAAADCIDSNGSATDSVQKVISANFEESEPFKQFIYCFSTKSRYVDNNGHFFVDKMAKIIGDHKDKSKFVDALNACNKNEGANPVDTMYKTALCFKDTSPLYFTI